MYRVFSLAHSPSLLYGPRCTPLRAPRKTCTSVIFVLLIYNNVYVLISTVYYRPNDHEYSKSSELSLSFACFSDFDGTINECVLQCYSFILYSTCSHSEDSNDFMIVSDFTSMIRSSLLSNDHQAGQFWDGSSCTP